MRNDVWNKKVQIGDLKKEIGELENQNSALDLLDAGLGRVGEATGLPGMVGSTMSSGAIKVMQTKNSMKISRLEADISKLSGDIVELRRLIDNRNWSIDKANVWRKENHCPA